MSTTDQELVLTHFIVSDDVERSRRFYTEVLGGTVISRSGGPTNVGSPTAGSSSIGAEARPMTSPGHPGDATGPRSGQQLPQYPGQDIETVYANGAPVVLNS